MSWMLVKMKDESEDSQDDSQDENKDELTTCLYNENVKTFKSKDPKI